MSSHDLALFMFEGHMPPCVTCDDCASPHSVGEVTVPTQCLHCCRANIQENIDQIRLQRELHEKSSCLVQVQQNFANLQEVKQIQHNKNI